MTRLQPDRLKSSRIETQQENCSQTSRQPRVIGTSDGEINADLSATPGYERNYDQLIEQAAREAAPPEIAGDGGSELEADVYRCGDCESIFAAENACSSYTVEATGEQMDFCTDRCPNCGTEVTNDRTTKTTATFDLTEEGDR